LSDRRLLKFNLSLKFPATLFPTCPLAVAAKASCSHPPGAYIRFMLMRNSRGRQRLAPLDFIHPCRPTVARRPPTGPGWVHELKHDGYRLQVHLRDGRVRLFTMNGHNWTDRYPRIVEEAARIKGAAILDAEAVCLDKKGVADFDILHNRTADGFAVACAFDLLMLNGDDLRRRPLLERKSKLAKLLIRSRGGIQYTEHAEGHGDKMFAAACNLGLEGIVSKRASSVYRSGPSKAWIKIKNPNTPAAMRALQGRF
jgi:bifunctional non-homologous end joining protein LigD